MKNLKYIFALSSIFVSLFAFSYATNFNDPKNDNIDSSKEDENEDKDDSKQNEDLIKDQIKRELIDKYNTNFSSTHNLKLKKGNLVYKNNNKPVTLDFSGLYSISNNALNSYVIDVDYTFDSSSEKFQVNSGSIQYSSITYNDNVYLFSSSNELSGILSFPSIQDAKYPLINVNFNFSTIFNSFLKLDTKDYEVYSSSTGYTFTNNNSSIIVDSNFNLLEIKSNYNDELSFTFDFKELNELTTSSKVIEDSDDFTNTLKGLFNNNSFDITYNASIKSSSSSDLKYNGYVSYLNDSLSLNVNEYIDNNLQNEITSTFKDENIYFNISNGKEKGNLIDSEITNLVSATTGLMSSNTMFNYSFNKPLNALINTSIFQNVLNLDLSSSYIKDLKEEDNLKTFKINSKAFGFNNIFDIRFELGLINNSLKSISIKDFNTTSTSVMNVDFTINKSKSNVVKINKEAYPIYNSLLPYYKKIIFIINEIEAGGNFTTSIIDNNSQTILGLSTHYDINLGKSINNINLENLNAALSNLNINFKDCTDSNKISSIATALFLEDTTSTSKNSFNLNIKNLNYKNKTFYIVLEENGSENKYTLESESIKGLISSIQKVAGSSGTETNSTEKGFKAIKNEIDRISDLVTTIQTNGIIKGLIEDVKNGCNFSNIPTYMDIHIGSNDVNVKFNLNTLIGKDTLDEYGLCTEVALDVSKDENKIVNVKVSDITFDGMSTDNTSTQTSIGLNEYDKDNILDDTTINSEWINTPDKPNNSKDLSEVIDKIDDVVQIYNKAIAKNSILQNLIDIDFIYKDKSLKGKLSTKFHFDENSNIDDKYIEGSIPLSFDKTSQDTNSLSGMNLEFIYSDSDQSKSKFLSLVDNQNKLTAGTQIGISLNYGDNDSRNSSKLYAYSDHDTVNSMLVSLSGLDDTNTLWPYEVIRNVQNYALTVKELINQDQVNTMDILEKLGINNTEGIMNLLNGLNVGESTLTAKVNLGSLLQNESENKDKLSVFNVNITLNFKVDYNTTTNENGESIKEKNVSLTSIEAQSVENSDLKCTIGLTSTYLEGELSATHYSSHDILSNFVPIKEASSSGVNYIDASNVNNLLQLGIYATNRKYYRINGTLNFDSNAVINLPVLGNITFNEIKPLNNLNFDIRLNLFKDEGNSGLNDIYKIKGYLKVQQQKNTSKITEFFIEPGVTDATGMVYVAQSTKENLYTDTKYVSENNSNYNEYFNENYSSFYESYNLTSVTNIYGNFSPDDHFTMATEKTEYSDYSSAVQQKENLIQKYPELEGKIDVDSYTTERTIVQTIDSWSGEFHNWDWGKGEDKANDDITNFINSLKNTYSDTSIYDTSELNTNNFDVDYTFKKGYKAYLKNTIHIYKKPNTYYYIKCTNDISELNEYNYKLKYKSENSITSCEIYHLDKEKFLGNCTYNNKSDAMVPRLLYYLLDYSGILNEETIEVEYKTIPAYISLKELMISNIFTSINGETTSSTINYLSGWKINVNEDNGYLNGEIEIDINELAKGIGTSGASVSFNTGLKLSFNQLSSDTWNFVLEQFDSNKYLVSANMKSGSVSMTLNVSIEKSIFNFTASNNADMRRWDSFVQAYKDSGLLEQSEYYVSNINAGETDVDAGAQWEWPFFYLKVTCTYSVNFNKNGANMSGSKVGDSTFFKYIEF